MKSVMTLRDQVVAAVCDPGGVLVIQKLKVWQQRNRP